MVYMGIRATLTYVFQVNECNVQWFEDQLNSVRLFGWMESVWFDSVQSISPLGSC